MFCAPYEIYDFYEVWDDDYWPEPPNVETVFPSPKPLTSQINNVPQVNRKSMFSRSGYLPVRLRERRKK